jgi:hypothetical protein
VFRNLRHALADVYPAPQDAQRVASDADIDIRRIDYGGSAEDFWQSTLLEADRSGRLFDLIDIAVSEYSNIAMVAWAYVKDQDHLDKSSDFDLATNGSGSLYRRVEVHSTRIGEHEQRITRLEVMLELKFASMMRLVIIAAAFIFILLAVILYILL